jgi:pimeloyl-ACP methyl ester carboxylesterase
MSELSFTETGNGKPLILIHGFPMHQKIWESFADKLALSFKVYTVDLPGFGKSPGLKLPFSIDDAADQMLDWLNGKGIHKCTLVGHSLGGYVALAMIKKSSRIFDSLVLFHSTAYPDSDEKKQSRNKVLEFIDKNGVHAFTSSFIAPLFANPQHPSIANVRSISMEASADTVKGYTQAMRDRPDTTDVLRLFRKPVLFLAGDKDPGIPADSIHRQAALSLDSSVHILPDVAHMGMFEKENESLEKIRSFVEENQLPKKAGSYKKP